MRFEFQIKDVNLYGELLYIQNEQSLQYRPHNPNIGVGVICGYYTELGVICETGEVVGFSGLNPHKTWITESMNVPLAKQGRLWIHFNDPLMKGTGIEYNRTWHTYYDAEKQYICIGDYRTGNNDDCVEFANNIIAVLRGDQLVAIWAKIKEVETAPQSVY